MKCCHFHICLRADSEGKHDILRFFLTMNISNFSAFNFSEADFFLLNINYIECITLNATSEYTKLRFDTIKLNERPG